jgi:putative glycosyltransferase (TIGR04372 family)
MWERKFIFLSGYLLNPIDRINKLIPGWKTHTIEFLYQDFSNLIEKYQPFDFTPDEEAHGKEMLNKFGLKDDDKFVCFAIRDSAYQLRKIPSRFRDWSYQDFRHQDIDNFVLAAEELTKRGYYVFRMGVVVHKAFNSNNPKIIDYPFSGLRSDFMDVYLGAKCSFCLSTGMGFDDVPYIFRRPIALIQCPIGNISKSHAYSEKFLIITKHHILKKENRRLSLSEIFSHGAAYLGDTKSYEQKGVELVDNTPEEIRDLAIETAENTEFKKQLNPEQEELQKTFKNLFAKNLAKPFEYAGKKYNTNHLHGHIRSHFSTKFLKENKDWLK